MFRRGIILVVLIGLFALGLLGVGGYAGWSQGFDAGLVAGAQREVPAYVPYAIGFSPVFLGVALFFKIALMFLILFVIFRMFRFFAWRTAGGPQGGPWGIHGRGHHHPHRRRDREQSSEDEAEETANGIPNQAALQPESDLELVEHSRTGATYDCPRHRLLVSNSLSCEIN